MRRFTLIGLLFAVAASVSPPLAAQTDTSFHAPTPTHAVKAALPADPSMRQGIGPEAPPTPASGRTLILTTVAGLALIGAIKTVSRDNNAQITTSDTLRAQHNLLVAQFNYFGLNHPAWNVSTAAVAPPLCARAGNTTGVKTTNTTQLFVNGVVLSLTATDNLWVLTGGNLAAGFFRRYLLLWDGTTATTVVSVLASSDAATKAGCVFPALPSNATTIVGVLTVQNATNPFIPGTTALSAAGVTDTYSDGVADDAILLAAQVTP